MKLDGICAGALSLLAFSSAGAVDFTREVKPVLEKSCVQCHGPEKQKGGLRLDTRAALIKGGENGPALVEGKPAESEMFRRAALPHDDEEAMPPKGKGDPLTPPELEAMKQWIAAGAPWPEGIVAVAVKADTGLGPGPQPEAEELAARAELAKHGVRVQPIAAGVNWTGVSFRKLGREMPPEALAHVGKLKTLLELDLGGTPVTDGSLQPLAALTNLEKLNLSGTAVGDAALEHLAGLAKLRVLNLFGTKVSDAGLVKLAALKELKRVYAAETKVTAEGVAALREKMPGVAVEIGAQFGELAKKTEAPAAAKAAGK